MAPNPPKKTRRRLVTKYQGRRLSFSAINDDDNDQGRSEELNVLFNSLDRFEKLWFEYQKRLNSNPAARKAEWDKKISILKSMRTTSISSVSVRKEKGERLNERKIKLSDGTELREYYIVGDPGFPSLQWLVTPFQRDEISESDLDFNKKHFETWEVAPRALARLKEEWKFLQNVWKPDMDKLPRMILACCILHNIVIDMNGEMHHELSSLYEHDPGYQQEIDESGNKPSTDLREKLSLYLSSKLEPRVEHAPEYQTG